MGWGRGARGGGKGKGSGNGPKVWQASRQQLEELDEEYTDEQWAEWEAWEEPPQDHSPKHSRRAAARDATYDAYSQQSATWPQQDAMLARPLAAQWRFVCRVLQRHAPEERVHERRQIRLGDHVFVQYGWDFAEQHGIVCSMPSEDSHGRRGHRDDPWVVHWVQEARQLKCSPLPQFSKGGELFRVSYPHWVCKCYVPSSTTMKPHITEEHSLEDHTPDIVAKRANTALRNGAWIPTWSQSTDIEFCIQTKTGAGPPVEVHGRKTLASSFQWPLVCAIGGERRPSMLFGVGRSGGSGTGGAAVSAPPGYTPQWSPSPVVPPQVMPVRPLETGIDTNSRYAGQGYAQPAMWPAQGWNGWEAQPPVHQPPVHPPLHPPGVHQPPVHSGPPQGPPQPLLLAASLGTSKQLSADAQEFVPGAPPASGLPAASFDGIYQ